MNCAQCTVVACSVFGRRYSMLSLISLLLISPRITHSFTSPTSLGPSCTCSSAPFNTAFIVVGILSSSILTIESVMNSA